MTIGSPEKERLVALDHGLRDEADRMLKTTGLGEILRAEGYEAVGSYVMHTMTWRDLDVERVSDTPDWERHWELGARLAKIDWVWKLHCTDAYRQPDIPDQGLYWGLRLSDPSGGPIWKMDLWTARAEEFRTARAGDLAQDSRARWMGLLNDETRVEILAIKEAVWNLPEYRREMLSVHIYEAVLERGVRGVDAFTEWWRARVQAVEA